MNIRKLSSSNYLHDVFHKIFIKQITSLKCRSGNQQVDVQFQKVLKTCRNHYADLKAVNTKDSMSMEDNSSESNSTPEDDKNFFYYQKDGRPSYNYSTNNQRYRDSRNRKSDFDNGDTNNGNMYFNNNTNQEQACIIQCFFNELNTVDQKGFPKKELVIPLMTQNIQDSELKDFVEESIIECFHYLESSKQEKCEFSQNLLICLAEKGQQKCEDWEN